MVDKTIRIYRLFYLWCYWSEFKINIVIKKDTESKLLKSEYLFYSYRTIIRKKNKH